MLQPQILAKPAATYVGLEEPFISAMSPDATNFKVIGPLWQRFLQQAQQIPHCVGRDMYGIMTAPPEAKRTHPHELQYLTAVAVSAVDSLPTGMIWREVPATTFAVFTHKGPITKIGDTISQAYKHWLPQSGYEHSDIADIELYDHRFCDGSEESEMEYWISVRRKS